MLGPTLLIKNLEDHDKYRDGIIDMVDAREAVDRYVAYFVPASYFKEDEDYEEEYYRWFLRFDVYPYGKKAGGRNERYCWFDKNHLDLFIKTKRDPYTASFVSRIWDYIEENDLRDTLDFESVFDVIEFVSAKLKIENPYG